MATNTVDPNKYPTAVSKSDTAMKRRIHRERVRGFPKTKRANIAMQPTTEKLQETNVRQAVPRGIQEWLLPLETFPGQFPQENDAIFDNIASSSRTWIGIGCGACGRDKEIT